ncbi:MAG: fibronectin type III domain-containing protein [Actinomycetota bacterium]|nr:fibronectin type III domain-containing protein [Actinomycetota bacterium]
MDQANRRIGGALRVTLRMAAVATISVPLLVSVGLAVASADADTNSPVLINEQFAPTTIDTATDTSVAVTIHTTDDLSGVADVEACFQSPSFTQNYCGESTEPTSGSPDDGVFQVTVGFPAHREVGSWTLAHVRLRDAAGNLRYVYASELDASSMPIALRVDDGPSLPGVPTGAFADRGSNAATVTWLAPSSDGGSPITGYTVTPYIGATPQTAQTYNTAVTTETLTGLSNGTTYTFRVAAVTNAGTGGLSDPTNAVIPASLPGPPTIGGATRGNGQATVFWTAPASDGGSAITGYAVTPYIGATPQVARAFATAATTEVITGLTNDTTYSFRVAATNVVGTGSQSDASNLVTPANRPPVASAGVDQTVASGASFMLQGSGSSDPDGDVLRYAWTRLSGPQVTIRNANTATATVTGISGPTTLVFRLTVTDPAGHSSTDDVTVKVSPK